MRMAYFHCFGTSTPPFTNDDTEQSPAQGEITVEGDLGQPSGDCVQSDSLFVHQRADDAYQILYCGPNV